MGRISVRTASDYCHLPPKSSAPWLIGGRRARYTGATRGALRPTLVAPLGPSYLLIGIMMCAPGVPANISQGRPSPAIDSSRSLPFETPIDSGVAPGTDSTHNS